MSRLERAAQAAYDADWKEPHHIRWHDAAEDVKHRYRAIAQAVMRSLIEPVRSVSEAEIEATRTPKGGWTKAQLAQWGVAWPPPKGWKQALLEHGA